MPTVEELTRNSYMNRVDDIVARFPGEWVAVRVTKCDSFGQDDEGVLVFHSQDESEVWDVIRGRSYVAAVLYSHRDDEPEYPLAISVFSVAEE